MSDSTGDPTGATLTGGIDPRGPRFAAAVTSVVLALTVLTGNVWLLVAQVVVFATGSLFGIRNSAYGRLYRVLLQPRLGRPRELEDPEPLRFAQTLGLAVTGLALVLAVLGVPAAVEVGAGLAFIAALLNATVGLCLGCELSLWTARLRATAGRR